MKKNRKLWRMLEAAAFCALLAAVVFAASRTLERKASRIKYEPFFERAGEYDVLFVGDSHMINGVYPMELWRDYGVAAYNLACVGNTLPVSYWTLMSALEEAQPELVVIGVNDVEYLHKLTGSSGDAHTALDALPFTRTKIRAIEDLMDDPYVTDDDGTPYTELKWEYYFTLGKYHERWSEFGKGDFDYQTNRQKGAEMAVGVTAPRDYDIIDENMAAEENGWGYAYLRMMIEACQERGIEVMLVHLPYPSTQEDQMAANAVWYISEEYGVDYVDFVSLDQVVDYHADCFDSYSHLNPSGARKVTDYIGRYITEHYGIPDRREDAAYAHWDADYDDYMTYKLERMETETELKNVLALLHDRSFGARIYVSPGSPAYGDGQIMRLMQNIAREHVFEEDAFAMWSDSLFPLAGLEEAAAQDGAYFADLSAEGQIKEHTGEEAEAQAGARFEGGQQQAGVSIEIIDRRTGETVAVRQF